MKKILIGLLVLGSFSSFAAKCDIQVKAPYMAIEENVVLDELDFLYEELEAKGYTISDSEDSQYSVVIYKLQYQFHEIPRYVTPVGVGANFFDKEQEKEIRVTKEDLAVIVGREDIRTLKVANKAAKKLLRKLPACE